MSNFLITGACEKNKNFAMYQFIWKRSHQPFQCTWLLQFVTGFKSKGREDFLHLGCVCLPECAMAHTKVITAEGADLHEFDMSSIFFPYFHFLILFSPASSPLISFPVGSSRLLSSFFSLIRFSISLLPSHIFIKYCI